MTDHPTLARRRFLLSTTAIASTGLLPAMLRAQTAPAAITPDAARPLAASLLKLADDLDPKGTN